MTNMRSSSRLFGGAPITAVMGVVIVLGTQRAWAQEITFPDANPSLNPYPNSGAGSTVPWPWNPLGAPPAPPPSYKPDPGAQQGPAASTPNFIMPGWLGGSPQSSAVTTPNTVLPSALPSTAAPPALPGTETAAATPSAAPSQLAQPGGAQEGEKKSEGVAGEEKTAEPEKKEEKKTPEEKAKEKEKKGKEAKKGAGGTEGTAEGEGGQEDKKAEEKEKKPEFTATAYDPIREALFNLNTRQYTKSLDALNRVLASNPNHPQAHYVRAIVQVMMRNYSGAARDYQEVLRLTPNSDLGRRAAEGLKKISF